MGRAFGWRHPRAHSVRVLFQNDKATPAVPTYLRETKVGRVVSLASLEEEREIEKIVRTVWRRERRAG